MRLRLTFQLLATIFLAVPFVNELAAQTSVTGEVAGTVADYFGAVVSDAAVSLKSGATGELENAKTDGLGQFRFALLKPGNYTLTVTAAALETSRQHVAVNLARVTRVAISLAIGTVTTTEEVTEQPPMLDARSGNLVTTYQTNQLASLPAPGGDITSYAYTAPGIVMNSGSGWGNFSAFGLLLPTGTKFSQNEGGEIVRFVGLSWLALAGLGALFRLLTGGAGANRKSGREISLLNLLLTTSHVNLEREPDAIET